MGKTFRKEKSQNPKQAERRHGDKGISHDHERTERKKELYDIQHHWDDADALDEY